MRMVALLRGINVGGNKRVPMVELKILAEKCGLEEVESYINSGNLVFEAGKLTKDKTVELLEKAIVKKFRFAVDIVVRAQSDWKRYAAGSPFAKAEKERPHLLHLGLSKAPCAREAAQLLAERTAPGEAIKILGDAIWVDFGNGVAKSKLTPAFFEKAVGSAVTMRNWKTVLKLNEMLSST